MNEIHVSSFLLCVKYKFTHLTKRIQYLHANTLPKSSGARSLMQTFVVRFSIVDKLGMSRRISSNA